MSKEYYRTQVANKRKEMVSLRAKVQKTKEDKKKQIDYISKIIKSTTSASTKESYRKRKITENAKYAREIDNLKKKIESVKKEIDRYKKLMASSK